jgi:hypothetical protein
MKGIIPVIGGLLTILVLFILAQIAAWSSKHNRKESLLVANRDLGLCTDSHRDSNNK